jgi:hypothetical protein
MPGKFEGNADESLAERLHQMTLDGGPDEETGDVQESGWYGLLIDTGEDDAPHAIVEEDSQGFFSYESYENEAEAREAWKKLVEKMLDEDADSDDPTEDSLTCEESGHRAADASGCCGRCGTRLMSEADSERDRIEWQRQRDQLRERGGEA